MPVVVDGLDRLRAQAAEGEVALKHLVEVLGATTLRYWKWEYESAGAPYGRTMAGFREWLVERGQEALVRSWE